MCKGTVCVVFLRVGALADIYGSFLMQGIGQSLYHNGGAFQGCMADPPNHPICHYMERLCATMGPMREV